MTLYDKALVDKKTDLQNAQFSQHARDTLRAELLRARLRRH